LEQVEETRAAREEKEAKGREEFCHRLQDREF